MILLATRGEVYVARLPGAREAEGNGVVGSAVAGEGAGAVVIGVAVRARPRRLEHGRVGRWAARRRRRVCAAAAGACGTFLNHAMLWSWDTT